jgi:hypothetical protein
MITPNTDHKERWDSLQWVSIPIYLRLPNQQKLNMVLLSPQYFATQAWESLIGKYSST